MTSLDKTLTDMSKKLYSFPIRLNDSASFWKRAVTHPLQNKQS